MTVIGDRYQVETTLGTGGMGVVYRAIDTRTGLTVAVKQLRGDLARRQPEMFERFTREAEALRQLNHPNIVQALDTFEIDDERYIVMEYVPGDDLSVVLQKEGSLPLPRALRIALEITDALTRAHYLKIVHRDLKPANVLISPDGAARLTDFGVAHLEEMDRVTRTGFTVGTPDYLPPEAFNNEPADERGDIWALGVMLFEMLGGKHPFSAETMPALMVNVLIQPTPDLEVLRPDAPVALIDLVYRMLEKDRAARIPSARLVGAELEAVMQRSASTPLSTGIRAQVLREQRFETPTPEPIGIRSNLPAQTTSFVGREAEVAALSLLLESPEVRLITLLGPGGMGKSRLAIETAQRVVQRRSELPPRSRIDTDFPFPSGVIFISLAGLTLQDDLLSAVADAVGFQFYQSDAPKQQLLDYFRDKSALIIIDNCEHLLDSLGLLSEILQVAPGIKIIATSRARLNLQGETLFVIEGMDFPESVTADPTRYSAVQLFVQSARRSKPGFELKPVDFTPVATICRLVRGMPLGIELAAAWVELLSVSEIAAEVASDLDFLETEAQDAPERHRSLRAVFEHSWELLNDEERKTFARLAVFRGRFIRQAGQAVTGASLRQLMALVNKSLIRRDPDSGVYQIHEMMRQYAEEKLEASGEAQAVRQEHSEYYIRALARARKDLISARQMEAHESIDADLDNVRAAWMWAAEAGQGEPLADSVHALGIFYDVRAQYIEGYAVFEPVVAALSKHPSTREIDRALGWMHAWMTLFKLIFRQGDVAYGHLLLMREAVTRSRDPECRAMLDFVTGMWERILGDAVKSREYERRSAAQFIALNMVWDRSHALCNLALASYFRLEATQTDVAMGILAADEALAIQESLGELYLRAHTLEVRGHLSIMVEEYERGARLIEESVGLFRKVGNRLGLASALQDLAWTRAVVGRFAEARTAAEDAYSLYRETGNLAGAAGIQSLRTRIEFFAGEFQASIDLAKDMLALAERVGIGELRMVSYIHLGRAYWASGALEESEEAWRNAYVFAEDEHRREDMSITLSGLVLVLLGRRRIEDASVLIETMELLTEDEKDFNQVATIHVFRGRIALLAGNAAEAVEHLSRAHNLLRDSTRVRVSYNWDEGLRNEFTSIALQGLAEAHRLLGDLGTARQVLREALHITQRFSYPAHIAAVIISGARILSALGRSLESTAMLAAVSDSPKAYAVERYRAASLLARARTELTDEQFLEAVSRGMMWTPETAVSELLRIL
ncbi:MAG: protein kinase [Chloroflexi bacterium]|nr:protein kinase [Chloroflexota bacterium]